MSKFKHSPGPMVAYGPTRGEGLTFTNEAHVGPADDNDDSSGPIAAVGGDDKEQAMANAALIADAFNVARETGLTPRELAGQRERLLAAAKELRSELFLRIADKHNPKVAHNWPEIQRADAAIADAEGGK